MLRTLAIFAFAAQIVVSASALAQGKPKDDPVAVTSMRNPVDKSYRRMLEGMDLFQKRHQLAPEASLRFKLLPRHRDTDMRDIQLEIVGDSFVAPIALAPDNSFALERRAAALKESASVRPNRKAKSMTWRAEIRTPGLPPDTRRLGDLRLECEVGMQAGLISNYRPFLFGLLDPLLREGPEYCRRSEPRYLFFAERPIFGVTLVAGDRRAALPVERLYAGASRDPTWKEDLAYCDCEVLVDRTYFLPLGDASWPDDTRIEFEYMDGTP
jgi:hypothetical protein